MSRTETSNTLSLTDEEASLVTRVCEMFSDQTIERALASAAAARADESTIAFRAALARELQGLLTTH